MMRRLTMIAMAVVLGGTVRAADPVEDEVRKAQAARFAATIKGDFEALAGMLADDLTYAHSNAKLETKPELLGLLKTGHYQYHAIVPRDVTVRAYGDTALATGLADIDVTSAGQPLSIKLRFLEAWVKRAGRWQLAAWQSTRLPAN